ncbi:MAG TPA: GntR family transcriptional regulator [Capsulimonadaceae bacterium]|jgi:DNA-binding LacI/PurR family transcriptional regulator
MPQIITKLPAKYRLVENALRDEIVAGLWQPGERLPGEHDLAKRFDVAYMTLRQAIAGLIDEGLLRRVNGKGTFVADRDAPSAPDHLLRPMALLIPSSGITKDSYYFPELLAGFQSAMEQHDMHIVPFNWEAPEPPTILLPGSAIACLMTTSAHYSLVERLRDSGFPVIAINRYVGRRTIPCVRIDDRHGVESAVDYLVDLGHTRLGFVTAVASNLDARDRLRGFRSAAMRNGLPTPVEAGDNFTEAAGFAAAMQMLQSAHRPTAIVCASDLSALGALKAARNLDLNVPRDLSIVGFGDFSIASYATPPLTTVRQQRFLLGQKSAESLIRLAKDEEVGNLVIPSELIVRESSAVVPVAAPTDSLTPT